MKLHEIERESRASTKMLTFAMLISACAVVVVMLMFAVWFGWVN